MNTLGMWPSQPDYQPAWLPGASFRTAVTSEYLGVGYIIGPRVAGTLFAGGVISWLVLMPAIRFFGSLAPNAALYPSTVPIPQMSPDQLWAAYIRPMGAGAVAASGLITLIKTMPTIWAALAAGLKDVRAKQEALSTVARTEREISMRVVLVGSVVLLVFMWALLKFKPIPGAQTTSFANLMAALFVVVFGFLFVTVASRISGLIGNSSNPVSGMTIATLMATCAIFLLPWLDGQRLQRPRAHHWRSGLHRCGHCGRDFAGFEDRLPRRRHALLAADRPRRRRDGFLVGYRRHADPDECGPRAISADADRARYQSSSRRRRAPGGKLSPIEGKSYTLVNAIGSSDVPDGKYLYDPGNSRD